MEKTKVCPVCNQSFNYTTYGGKERKYCSLDCARKAQAKRHYENTPERHSNYNHKGYMSKTIILRYGGRCAICGWRATEDFITVRNRRQYAYGNEIHHIVAVEDGGTADENNLILLCPNHHKQANLGIISVEELKRYIINPPTRDEKQRMICESIDRVASSIFTENNCKK